MRHTNDPFQQSLNQQVEAAKVGPFPRNLTSESWFFNNGEWSRKNAQEQCSCVPLDVEKENETDYGQATEAKAYS